MPALMLFVDETEKQDYMTKYEEAANELKDEILFVIVSDLDNDDI